jgi:benzoyl-CoA reductase subunit C
MTQPGRVFTEWEGKPLEEVLYLCRELMEDPAMPTAARWREAGGKTVGHFQVYFPRELAHAAGMLPLSIRGAPVEPTRADSRFGSYLCSILKTSLELALSGRVVLDMFVSHPICDAARNLAAVWGRNFKYPCQILYLPQNPNSGASHQYLRDEYERLLDLIERVSGKDLTKEDLAASVSLFNRSRSLIRELYDIKREEPWRVSAEDAYCLMACAGVLPVEDHIALMEWVLPELREREAKAEDRIRVVFEGGFCEQPPLDLIRMIGRSCYVVDDDLMVGLRFLIEDVDPSGDPISNLARAYLDASSYSPVQHDDRKPKEKMLRERLADARAEAAILAAAKMCEPGLEEQVTYIQAMDEDGTPYFVTEFEENMTSFNQLELQLETFAENLIFG